jgi:ring-1,2-phenylacetyl-CoA epoxidase subunit PaaE
MSQLFHSLTISDIRRETDDAISVAFDLSNGARERFGFTPGQYITLRTRIGGEEVRRSYSICSGLDDGELRVGIRQVPEGLFSTFAHRALKVGDVLDVMPPEGRFGGPFPKDDTDAPLNYLAFAAGSGITPIMSLIKSYLTRQPQARFMLAYGNRTSGSIMFKDALEDLKDRFVERLAVHHVLSREKQDVALLDGRIDPDKASAFLRLCGGTKALTAAFLCGPIGMMDAISEALAAEGVHESKIRREVFGTGEASRAIQRMPAPEAGDVAKDLVTLSVRIDGVTHALSLSKNETVLDGALRHGLDLPYSCHAGMCCTCRAKLVEGEVEMIQNFSLEPWEMDAGFVLTCQALPKSAAVSVDFDAV